LASAPESGFPAGAGRWAGERAVGWPACLRARWTERLNRRGPGRLPRCGVGSWPLRQRDRLAGALNGAGRYWHWRCGGAVREDAPVIGGHGLARLPPLVIRLVLFPQFPVESGKAPPIRGWQAVFPAEIQVIPQPLEIVRPLRDRHAVVRQQGLVNSRQIGRIANMSGTPETAYPAILE
jgi:hypothetical protein